MRTEVRRGRKFVEYIDDSLPVGTFVQEIGAHDVSYQDEQGAWLPADENWETDGLDGFSFRAQRMNHKVRFDSIGAWRWYPRRNVETEYIIINRPKCWLTRTSRWGNLLVNGISREGRDITLTSLRNVTRVIHSSWNGIKTDWILENADAPTRFQQQIGLVGLTEVDGWLYGADGEQVARLTPTTAIDAEGNELPTSTSYQNGILEFSADVTGAVFPVTVDPDFAAGSTFGTVSGGSSSYATARSTSSVSWTTFLNCGNSYLGNPAQYEVRRAFINFDTSSIPDTDTINQVNLRLVATGRDVRTNDFDIQIVKYDWSGQDPLAAGNREAAFDGCLAAAADDNIWRNTSGMSTNTQYTSGNLSTAWVNKTGTTYYGLRSSRDVAAANPKIDSTAACEKCVLAPPTHATESYRPVLIVAYSASSQNLTLTCAAGSYSLTGTNADFEVKRNYVLNAVYPDMIVSGAEYSAANGTYVETGTYNGRPRYIHESNADYVIVWDSPLSWWIIYDEVDVTFGYYTVGDAATPDLGSSWTNGLTETPSALTVTAANAYKLTGTDATLTYTQGAQNLTLTCAAGSYSLTGTNADLTVTRHYTLVCESGSGGTPSDIVVSGAGSTDVNGTYVEIGTLQGKPRYRYSTNRYLQWTGTQWRILFPSNRYYSNDDVATPDLCTTWAEGTGALPVPTVTADAATTYVLTGTDATLTYTQGAQNLTLTCAAGSYSLTGTDVSFAVQRNYSLECGTGNYTLTGTNALFEVKRNYAFVCEAGSYSLTGTNAAFEVKRNYIFTLESGSYTLTGTDVTLTKTTGAQSYTLVCSAGSYALTGTNTGLTSARTIALASGSYALTGTNADFYRALVMACNSGSYALTGTDATFNANYVFALGMGSYVLVGTACGLFILSPTPACRTATIEFENRTFAIPHENRTLEVKCH